MQNKLIKSILLVLLCTLCLSSNVVFADNTKDTEITYNLKAKVSFINELEHKTYEYEYESGDKLVEPEHSKVEGYTFGGWYKDKEYINAWNFGYDTVTSSMSLYAKWIPDTIETTKASGGVTDDGKTVSNAKVELMLGKELIAATTTDENGDFSFNEVEAGIYNIVITNEENGKTMTQLVDLETPGSIEVNIVLPKGDVNSKIEHEGEEVPKTRSTIEETVVGGLDVIASNQPHEDSDKITVILTVEPKEDKDTKEQQLIKEEVSEDDIVEFLDLSLWLQVNDGDYTDIGDNNDTLLTIIIPFNFEDVDVDSLSIIRVHNDIVETLTTTPNTNGEYFIANKEKGTITFYAKKFSDYAIAYSLSGSDPEPPIPPKPPTPPKPPIPPTPVKPEKKESLSPYVTPNTGVIGLLTGNSSSSSIFRLVLIAMTACVVVVFGSKKYNKK